jgi:gluconolactonase
LQTKYDGKSIDGPNDVITDAKGGVYFTDPQFTMEPTKFQPGRAVYYVSPDGKVTRVTEPNEFAMPNGIVLSPDGKTLFINNCYDDESWYPVKSEKDNFIWAYDVGCRWNDQQWPQVCHFIPDRKCIGQKRKIIQRRWNGD